MTLRTIGEGATIAAVMMTTIAVAACCVVRVVVMRCVYGWVMTGLYVQYYKDAETGTGTASNSDGICASIDWR